MEKLKSSPANAKKNVFTLEKPNIYCMDYFIMLFAMMYSDFL